MRENDRKEGWFSIFRFLLVALGTAAIPPLLAEAVLPERFETPVSLMLYGFIVFGIILWSLVKSKRVKEVGYRSSVLGLGAGLGLLTLLYFLYSTDGSLQGLLRLVFPLFLSLGVVTLGIGLIRSETNEHQILAIGVAGIGGLLLTVLVSTWTTAVQQMEGTRIAYSNYLILSNASLGAALGTILGVYRVRLQQRTNQLAREVNRLNEFAGIVAHDLRNPLHIAQGYLGEVPRDGVEAELTSIERAHTRMERLIDHVLSISRQGNAVGETTSVSIPAVAEAAWTDVPTKTAEFNVVTDFTIEADDRRLRSLFENLFRNAIEHGGDTVTVIVGEVENGFFVEDDGPGIPPTDRERIFEGGYSQDGSGTGLGLAIVRQIADAHDWTITVTESETGGARFEFAQR